MYHGRSNPCRILSHLLNVHLSHAVGYVCAAVACAWADSGRATVVKLVAPRAKVTQRRRADAACAGFALLETGSSPRRHALNVFSKNVLDMLLNALWFWALGYAFGFGKDVGGVLGTSNFFLEDTSASLHWFEQWVFATNASTIFGGCIAGRAKFAAYMVIASVTSAWTYPVVAHWVWHADGWLATMGQNGVLDFSGSGVVHLTGGVIGLVVRVCRLFVPVCPRVVQLS